MKLKYLLLGSSVQFHLLLYLSIFVLGCANGAQSTRARDAGEATGESRRLNQLFEDYFEEYLKLFPTVATSIGDHRYDNQLAIAIGEEHRTTQRQLYLKSLAELGKIEKNRLDPSDAMNYTVFERLLKRRLEGLNFDQYLMPVRQLGSLPVEFPVLGSGKGDHRFKTVADYDNFLGRMANFPVWVDTAIANMRVGVKRGIIQPRVVMERTLPQLEGMIVADPKQSLFFQPILDMPGEFGAADRRRLTDAYLKAIDEQVVPTYHKLRSFIEEEYLPKSRLTIGMSDLPDGNRWYDYLVKTQTTTDLAPEEIFELGMSEIARIKKEMERLRLESDFQGGLDEFNRYLAKQAAPGHTSRTELVEGYEAIREKVSSRLPRLFGRLPNASFEIRTIEEFRERSAPSQYSSAAPDGSRPGIFYVNAAGISDASPRRASESLFLHEALPGHHLQISLQYEQQNLPRFRRFGGYNAFIEGWALYAESLGAELGLYTEPSQYLSRLNSELFRAARLVVDTGLHRKGWSREQALKFLMETTMTGEVGATLEIDRYIAWPGQALAYKIGQLKILAIRGKAEKALGSKFDIRAFHDELLKDGALPLDLLESKMDAWIASRR
jgi:uncharacterized protein (DUF885 family)